MASVFGHSLVAYTISKVLDKTSSKVLIILAILSSIIPDIDVLGFYFGIDYLHPLGHRGFTHSILFAVLWSGLLAFVFGKSRKVVFAIVLFLSTISHGILDAMTSGGEGVGFFIPFQNMRYFFSFRAIQVSPIGIEKFFSEWGLNVVLSEMRYIGIPFGIVLLSHYIIKKQQ